MVWYGQDGYVSVWLSSQRTNQRCPGWCRGPQEKWLKNCIWSLRRNSGWFLLLRQEVESCFQFFQPGLFLEMFSKLTPLLDVSYFPHNFWNQLERGHNMLEGLLQNIGQRCFHDDQCSGTFWDVFSSLNSASSAGARTSAESYTKCYIWVLTPEYHPCCRLQTSAISIPFFWAEACSSHMRNITSRYTTQ